MIAAVTPMWLTEQMTDAERARRYRDRRRGAPPRQPQPHGTPAAFRRHERHGEEPCAACRVAEAERQRQLYERRRRS